MPGFVRQAKVGDVFPVRKDAAGKPLCRYCGGPVQKPRRAWCCNECQHQALIRSHWGYARHAVILRDRGVCARCGVDTVRRRRIARRWLQYVRNKIPTRYEEFRDRLRTKYHAGVDHIYEIDHIIPVSEGGGLCGLDGLRTLCIQCHRHVTAELSARRAKAKTTDKALAVRSRSGQAAGRTRSR